MSKNVEGCNGIATGHLAAYCCQLLIAHLQLRREVLGGILMVAPGRRGTIGQQSTPLTSAWRLHSAGAVCLDLRSFVRREELEKGQLSLHI